MRVEREVVAPIALVIDIFPPPAKRVKAWAPLTVFAIEIPPVPLLASRIVFATKLKGLRITNPPFAAMVPPRFTVPVLPGSWIHCPSIEATLPSAPVIAPVLRRVRLPPLVVISEPWRNMLFPVMLTPPDPVVLIVPT